MASIQEIEPTTHDSENNSNDQAVKQNHPNRKKLPAGNKKKGDDQLTIALNQKSGTSENEKTSDQYLKHSPNWKDKRKEEERKKADEVTPHLPLYKAAREGDWETAHEILKNNPSAMTAKITTENHTVLHIAVAAGDHAIQFIQKLLADLDPASLFHPLQLQADDKDAGTESILKQVTAYGNTPLALAAGFGNMKAVKLLVEKNWKVLTIPKTLKNTPIHLAAKFGHKETVCYLLDVIKEKEEPTLLAGQSGAQLLKHLINADLYGIALDLLNHSPELPLETALEALAKKPLAFASGSHFGVLKRRIYHCLPDPVVMDNFPPNSSGKPSTNSRIGLPRVKKNGDPENPTANPSEKASTNSRYHRFLPQISCTFGTLVTEVNVMLWSTIVKRVTSIKHIRDAKLMHKQTHELVKLMCAKVTSRISTKKEVTSKTGANAFELLRKPLLTATRLGIHEFVTEIIKTYPHLIWYRDYDEDGHNVFSLAVLLHHERIFSLIYQIGSNMQYVVGTKFKFGNNILHLAGNLQPSTRVSGAALQMQRELQWFKEVEKLVKPSYKEMKNFDQKTPRKVFTDEHEELVKQGEKWMKGTASSCTLVASLVLTVVFAAAFTVPGGNNGEGIPIFLHEPSFMVFAVSDAIALFSSSTSLLMFLGILTSRYSEEDFLMSLPLKLIIGLLTLFISIISMVIAFSAAFYILLFHRFNLLVVIIPIGVLACFPVSSFALQIPLLLEILQSTFGRGIFHNPSKEIIG